MNNNKLLWLVLHTMTGLIFLGLVYLLFFEESLFEHMANYLCLSLLELLEGGSSKVTISFRNQRGSSGRGESLET